jgi:hypothetical protein
VAALRTYRFCGHGALMLCHLAVRRLSMGERLDWLWFLGLDLDRFYRVSSI